MHPVDRLAQIRQHIELLNQEAASIRGKIATGEVSTIGDEFRATWRKQLVLRPTAANEAHSSHTNGRTEPYDTSRVGRYQFAPQPAPAGSQG